MPSSMPARFARWLRNEPVIKAVFTIATLQAMLVAAASFGWVTHDQTVAIEGVLAVIATPGFGFAARQAAVGPVTHEQAVKAAKGQR